MLEAIKQFFTGQEQAKIIRDPAAEKRQKYLLVLVLLVSVVVSFFAGEYWTSYVAVERDELADEVDRLESELHIEKLKNAANDINAASQLAAVNLVRDKNTELQQQISALEEEVAYYQRVLNPIKNDKGLRLEAFSVEQTSDANRYWVNIVLTQLGKQNRSVTKGLVTVQLEGSLNGKKQSYDLQNLKLDSSSKDLALKFRFRYYQEISEEIVLPQGFVPERVHITAQASGKKAMRLEEMHTWKPSD